MSNHVHLIAVPGRADSLPMVLRDTHGRYATYLNGRQGASGHVWQGRYFSCRLDGAHLWAALRYVEQNPVRARMVARADEYAWSSAAAYCGGSDAHVLLDAAFWTTEWTAASWKQYLSDEAEGNGSGAILIPAGRWGPSHLCGRRSARCLGHWRHRKAAGRVNRLVMRRRSYSASRRPSE